MEEFLSGESFEKMAREYNKKYSSVAVLGSELVDKQKLTAICQDAYKLFVSLNNLAKTSKEYDQLANEVWKEINKIKKSTQIDFVLPSQKDCKLSYKECVYLLISLLLDMSNIENESNFQEFFPLHKKVLEATKCYFRAF